MTRLKGDPTHRRTPHGLPLPSDIEKEKQHPASKDGSRAEVAWTVLATPRTDGFMDGPGVLHWSRTSPPQSYSGGFQHGIQNGFGIIAKAPPTTMPLSNLRGLHHGSVQVTASVHPPPCV